jgi:DUF971 family protein
MPLTPLRISRPKPYLIAIDWSDGFCAVLTLRSLRDACPCASCKGENIMGTQYGGLEASRSLNFGLTIIKPGMYELRTLTPVGNYAVSMEWADGHATGIYSWDILRRVCEEYHLSEAQMQDVERLAGN